MCIAIANPEGKIISENTLRTCWEANPDGAGFAVVGHDSKVQIHKGFMTFDAFWNVFKHFNNKPTIIHFRIKTHGSVKPENCHPFQVNDNLAFIHNGIISNVTKKLQEDEVDTQAFNRLILQKMPTDFYKNDVYMELISEYIGFSKLVFLDANNKVVVVNEGRGDWNNGVWYSNSSYKPKPVSHVPVTNHPRLTHIQSVDTLKMDDWVKLVRKVNSQIFGVPNSLKKLKAGSFGFITGFTQHGNLVVMLEDDLEYIIPPYTVKKISYEMLPNDYNDMYYGEQRIYPYEM